MISRGSLQKQASTLPTMGRAKKTCPFFILFRKRMVIESPDVVPDEGSTVWKCAATICDITYDEGGIGQVKRGFDLMFFVQTGRYIRSVRPCCVFEESVWSPAERINYFFLSSPRIFIIPETLPHTTPFLLIPSPQRPPE